MAPVAQWPPASNPRSERVTSAVRAALAQYEGVLTSDAPFRAITIEVKMRDDQAGVRAVLVSFQGEAELR